MITKSNYVSFCKCPRLLYLSLFEKDKEEINEESIRKGNEVGVVARGYFGDYCEVGKNTLDMEEKAKETLEYIKKDVGVICEASFIYRDLFCAVDILKKSNDGYEIYEVKSTTSTSNKDVMLHYYQDIAFQYYVLSKLGYKINGVYLMMLNENYIRGDVLDTNSLFKVFKIDDDSKFVREKEKVRQNLIKVRSIVEHGESNEHNIINLCINGQCSFSSYCMKNLREDSILNLYSCRKKIELYNSGYDTFDKVLSNSTYKLTPIQRRQITYFLDGVDDVYVEKENLKEFLDTIKFPIYFLDFESINEAIPPFKNSRVYQQIPVQFSLHVLDEEGKLSHYEFIGDGVSDPREEVIKALLDIIKDDDGSIVSYNASFEKNRIKELFKVFPIYNRLNMFEDRFVDLLDPFKAGNIYSRKMKNSFSIKSTLPALFEDDKELDYHSLNLVHNGSEAMKAYNSLKHLDEVNRKELIDSLLKYCELDTYAMYKLYVKLKELVE